MQTLGRIVIGLTWLLTVAGALLGGAIVALGAVAGSGAPQQAAAAGVGLACAVIPYVLLRAFLALWEFPFS